MRCNNNDELSSRRPLRSGVRAIVFLTALLFLGGNAIWPEPSLADPTKKKTAKKKNTGRAGSTKKKTAKKKPRGGSGSSSSRSSSSRKKKTTKKKTPTASQTSCAQLMVTDAFLSTRTLPERAKLTGQKVSWLKKKQVQIIDAPRSKGWPFGKRIGKLSPANKKYLAQQIENLHRFNQILHADYQGMGYAYEILQNALMLKWHALLIGGPGGAKSHIAERFASSPVLDENGKLTNQAFRILMHQMVQDAEIRGITDIREMMSWKGSSNPKDFIQNRNTLMLGRRVFIDEVEKATGKALQPTNDVLASRAAYIGPFALQSRLETAFGATNLVPSDFVSHFNALALRSTAEPLLDRFPFKVWFVNYLAQSDDRLHLLQNGAADFAFQSMADLIDPTRTITQETGKPILLTDPSNLPHVDWTFLGAVAGASHRFRPDFVYVVEALVDQLRTYYNKSSIDDQSSASFGNKKIEHYPPNLLTNRTLYNLAIQTIIVNSFLDFLNVDDSLLSIDEKIAHIERGIPLDRFSSWRASKLFLYGAPGAGYPVVNDAGRSATIDLPFGPELKQLRDTSYDLSERAFIDNLILARTEFARIWVTLMDDHKLHGEKLADRLKPLLGAKAEPNLEEMSMELWLLRARRIHGMP